MDDFYDVIDGKTITNKQNEIHLKRYYPCENYLYTSVKCNIVILGINKGRMYMEIEGKTIIDEQEEKYQDYYDKFTMDIEKIDGKWIIEKVNFEP